MERQAAAEIDRICALKGAEREAALAKLQKETGLQLYCSDPK